MIYRTILKSLIVFFILNSVLVAEILIINVESDYNKGIALVGIYDKKENFGKAKVNKKLNTEKVLTGAVTQIVNQKGIVKLDIPFGSYVVSGLSLIHI